MSRYVIRQEHVGPWPTLSLIDMASGGIVTVACRGARLLHFKVPVAGELRDIADGYRDAK